MRFKLKDAEIPYQWEQREVRFFTWLPLRIHGEIRWLETVVVHQQYAHGEWKNVEFLN